MTTRYLVLGGARSGKTRHALRLAQGCALEKGGTRVTYVATAQPLDDEMSDRIRRHRAERPPEWTTIEAPLDLADRLERVQDTDIVVVDCLTLWLSNALLPEFDEKAVNAELARWERERQAFETFVRQCRATLILVSNEVGSGIVPESALARRFQDEQGRLNQSMASICDHVALVVAGLALTMK